MSGGNVLPGLHAASQSREPVNLNARSPRPLGLNARRAARHNLPPGWRGTNSPIRSLFFRCGHLGRLSCPTPGERPFLFAGSSGRRAPLNFLTTRKPPSNPRRDVAESLECTGVLHPTRMERSHGKFVGEAYSQN